MLKHCTALLTTLCTLLCAHAAAPVRSRILPGTTAATEAVVFWEKPDDYERMIRYVVRVDGRTAGTTDHDNLRLSGLKPSTTYRVRVDAVDASGKEWAGETTGVKTICVKSRKREKQSNRLCCNKLQDIPLI